MKNKILYFFVLLYFTVFVISNSIFVSNNNDVELDSSSLSYWLRHIVAILVSFYSILFYFKKGVNIILNIFVFSLIYFICQQYILGFMTIAFFLSSIVFGSGYELLIKNKNLLLILFFISLVPFFLNFNEFINNGFFSTKYGRERLLLGYFHPKEAAQPFVVLFILLFISYKKYRTTIFIGGTILLLLISSKNSTLYFLIFIYLTRQSAVKTILLFFILFLILYYIFINLSNINIFIDELSSNRISAWLDVMKYNQNNNSKFKADSFYIEIFVKGGLLAVLLFICWFIYFIFFNKIYVGLYSALPIGLALLCSQLIFSIFDSGITSTGSLVHIFSWSMYYKFSKKYI
jgi:hypothetical protein